MHLCKYLLAVLIICAVPISAKAQLERTIWARDTRTPDQGNVSPSLGWGYETYEYKGMKVDGHTMTTSFFLSYGILANWSVGFKATYDKWQETGYGVEFCEDGAGDAEAITTVRMLDEDKSGIDLALRGSLRIPTGDEDKYLGTGNWEPKLQILAAKTLGKVITVVNLGIRRIISSAEHEEDFLFDTSLEGVLPLTDQLCASVSMATWTSRWKTSEDDNYFQLGCGLKFSPTKNSFFSVGVYRIVNSEVYKNDLYFSLGTGIEF